MAKAGVLFITQDMVIGEDRNAVILLGVEATDPRQAIADANLKPGLIEPVFQLADYRIA